MWWKYYLPLCWTFTTRYPSPMNVISFFLIDAFPSFFLVFASSGWNLAVIPEYLVAFFVMFCFYECGYIFNEILCVRYEQNPTIRIDAAYWTTMPRHMENLLTLRVLLGVLGSWWLVSRHLEHMTVYLCCVLGLMAVYSIHNFYRGRINLLTMPGDVSGKYLIPMALFLAPQDLFVAWADVFLAIIGVRMLEYASKKSLIPGFDAIKDVDAFRIRYYVATNILAIALAVLHVWSWVYCFLPAFFFCYRIATWYLMHHAKGVQKRIDANRKRHGTLR